MKTSYTLREIRIENKMTQIQFAKELGISRFSLINYEKGSRKIPEHVKKKVEETYEIEIIDLYRKPVYTLAKRVDYENSEKKAQPPFKEYNLKDIILSVPSGDKKQITFKIFKLYLTLSDFPIECMTTMDIMKLQNVTRKFLDFQIYKKKRDGKNL